LGDHAALGRLCEEMIMGLERAELLQIYYFMRLTRAIPEQTRSNKPLFFPGFMRFTMTF
jgi:hypothetical protein